MACADALKKQGRSFACSQRRADSIADGNEIARRNVNGRERTRRNALSRSAAGQIHRYSKKLDGSHRLDGLRV